MLALIRRGEILIGSDNQAGIRFLQDIRTDRVKFLFLNKPQQLDLGGFIQIADFIKKQGAAGSVAIRPSRGWSAPVKAPFL